MLQSLCDTVNPNSGLLGIDPSFCVPVLHCCLKLLVVPDSTEQGQLYNPLSLKVTLTILLL